MRSTLGMVLALFGWGCLFVHCAEPPPKSAQQAAAEAAYGAALLQCVDDAKTLAESKACRARVDAQWGVIRTETRK